MTDDTERKKPNATRILLGLKEPPEKPDRVYQETMQFTPSGTTMVRAPTPEGRQYLSALAEDKARAERDSAAMASVPRATPGMPGQERSFRRDGPDSDKMNGKENDKDNDLER